MGDDEASEEEAVARRVWTWYSESDFAASASWHVVAGGFSGAQLWRVEVRDRSYCLRRWPREFPDVDRLVLIHRVLRHVAAEGIAEVAIPLPSRAGQSFVEANGALWELQPWMPGSSNYNQAPSPGKLSAALRFLARFHVAAAGDSVARHQHPPGIIARCEQLRKLMHGGLDQLSASFQPNRFPELLPVAEPLLKDLPRLAPGVRTALESARQLTVSTQVCIRDIWHDHLLFTGEQLTGVIDFGAMNDDHVACDLSRLLGSLVADDPTGWATGLAAYESIRPLTMVDRQLVRIYDRSAVLLSVANWLKWLYVERRQFPDLGGVRRRLEFLKSRLLVIREESPVTRR